MLEGIFRIAYTGMSGSGLGILVLHKGTVVGADSGGGIYDGSYTENADTGTIDFAITLAMSAGVTPVMTGIPVATPINLPIKISLRPDAIGGETPTLVQTTLGPVNVLLKKIRDFP